ncbi:hydroxyacid dehydrogenase [Periweissella beninensis]|nr:hydroxyacid dehydrogenase [Periweissella beninensis]
MKRRILAPEPKKVAKKKTVKYHKKKVVHKKKKVRLVKSSTKYRFKNKRAYNIAVSSLKKANYKGAHIVYVNHNAPRFTKAQLSHKTLYAKYNNRDRLGRATGAMALLSKSEMPSAKRQALSYNPTGWHSIKLYSNHYLYDRTHLIGYQFTGQNNNSRNLITATSVLNRSQGMEKYENRVATYLRGNRARKILYRVTPIYHGNNLVASGVHMEAQSIGSNAIKFNIYIFNVQNGLSINYKTGTAK